MLDAGGYSLTLKTALAEGTAVDIVLRPENLQICSNRLSQAFDAIPGKIRSLAFQGSNVEYDVDIGWGTSLRVLGRPQEGRHARNTCVGLYRCEPRRNLPQGAVVGMT